MTEDLLTSIFAEFSTQTYPDVNLATVNIVHAPDPITDEFIANAWVAFRNTPQMIERYGTSNGSCTLADKWCVNNLFPVFKQFAFRDIAEDKPYYLCICRESGDEYIIRRSMRDDTLTKGRFMSLNCEFSKMKECIPRNRLKNTRISNSVDGEYLLCIMHIPGTLSERDIANQLINEKMF